MNFVFHLVDVSPYTPKMTWPKDWPLPRLRDVVILPGCPPLCVKKIEWAPQGDDTTEEPYVFIEIGRP